MSAARPKSPTPRSVTRRAALRPLVAAAAAGACGPLAWPARAQAAFPARPLTLVMPTAAATTSDLIGRMVGKTLSGLAGVPVIADNKPGANGVIGVQAVINAPADGHTLLYTTLSTMAVNKALVKNLPYEPLHDLVTLGIGNRLWMTLVVSAKQPFRTPQELVAFAKRQPGRLNFGYGASVTQMSGKVFEQRAGVSFTEIPYKSQAMMVQGLVSGEVDVTLADPAIVAPFVKNGQLRMIGSASAARLAGFPDVPTLTESGLSDLELGTALIVMAKAGTPRDIQGRLTDWVLAASRNPEVQALASANYFDSFYVTGPDAQRYLAREIDRWAAIARTAGLQPS